MDIAVAKLSFIPTLFSWISILTGILIFETMPEIKENFTETAGETSKSQRRRDALELKSLARDLIAMSRTYNVPGTKAAGTFGQELAGVSPTDMIASGQRKRIIFMNENDDSRANLGCVNGVDQVFPPFNVTITPPSWVTIMRSLSLGSNLMS